MVEHSVVVNEEAAGHEQADYMKALQSAMNDHDMGRDGSSGGGASKGRVLKNNFVGFTREEDLIIERTLLQIRDRIRNG